MVKKPNTNAQRLHRHKRVRGKVTGTAERPRLNVFRSANHIYAQLIDDVKGVTITAMSSNAKDYKGKTGGNSAAAADVGKALAAKAKKLKITKVVFDRGGYLYHGRVKALADGAREGGLEF
ncbi:MAG: 50S ribosomal protein L18 [Oscillospiraceae bacterium]|nr:50S ribosomal protein L18 [Oscillospiraceae bacterium]